MVNVVVVTGVSGSGKSTFCKSTKKAVLVYDTIYSYQTLSINKEKCKVFLDQHSNDDVIYLDAFNNELLEFIQTNYNVNFLKFLFVYTNTDDLYDIIHKNFPRNFGSKSYNEFIRLYKNEINVILSNIRSNKVLSNTSYLYRNGDKYTEYDNPDHISKLINEPIPNRLFNFIKNTSGHASYQTVEYNGEKMINGSERDYITMNNILKCTGLHDKRIMDTGCFNGYFSFQCLKNGAKKVIGVDHNEPAINICNKISLYNNYHSWVMGRKINNCCPEGIHFYLKKIGVDNIFIKEITGDVKLDVIFALNYLHHLKNELGHDTFITVIDSFFKNSKEIIFEINEPEMNDIESIAKKNKYSLKQNIESHRKTSFGNRRILHYVEQ